MAYVGEQMTLFILSTGSPAGGSGCDGLQRGNFISTQTKCAAFISDWWWIVQFVCSSDVAFVIMSFVSVNDVKHMGSIKSLVA